MFDATMTHRMQQEAAVAQRADLPGAAHLVLDATVAHFDPEVAMFGSLADDGGLVSTLAGRDHGAARAFGAVLDR
ncbi:hypothetical protein [Frankia sp. EAN1pec]|uniref:hypothetical protein n=1 Tax=Parafrankia sp. (strain EAN1pec) TaxID=298653 RepID=UPI0012F7698A